MLIILIRTIILYFLTLVVMRLMGKREIGQLQPFEFTIAIMIADVATIPMSDVGVPITNGIVSILGLLLMHLVISYINMKSVNMRAIICGKPSILIYRGEIQEQNLKKERYTINELEERLRGKGVTDFSEIDFAILETNGEISIVEKPEKRNVRPEDLNINAQYEGIIYDLVIDGKVMRNNLQKVGKDYIWLEKKLKAFKIKPEEALIVTINGKGEIFCQAKQKNKN